MHIQPADIVGRLRAATAENKDSVHRSIDKRLNERSDVMLGALAAGETDQLWREWSECVEGGMMD
eukprot:12223362-Alexandrium_andersonii.AAC.1